MSQNLKLFRDSCKGFVNISDLKHRRIAVKPMIFNAFEELMQNT